MAVSRSNGDIGIWNRPEIERVLAGLGLSPWAWSIAALRIHRAPCQHRSRIGCVARLSRLTLVSQKRSLSADFMSDLELIFEMREDEIDGGYTARALGCSIFTEAETLEELRKNVREAVDCHFDESMPAPRIIRLHFVRDEVLTR